MSAARTKRQEKILQGLKEIAGEGAVTECFISALEFYSNPSLSNRVGHLAHSAREIDGGLRDILSPRSLQKELEKNLLERKLEQLFGTEFKTHKGHIASILSALDVGGADPLAKTWFDVSKQFHKYAHRPGALKKSREFTEFQYIWEKYEEVLDRLIGSYLAVTERIDRLMSLTHIDEVSIGAV